MNSPLSGDTASSRRLFSVFMRCWQTGREAGSTSTGTTSHWQRETRLEVLELPFSWPPFPFFLATLRPLPHSSPPLPSPSLCNVTSQEEASRGSFVPTILPPRNDPFWHTDPILTRPITVPLISNNAGLLFLPANLFF